MPFRDLMRWSKLLLRPGGRRRWAGVTLVMLLGLLCTGLATATLLLDLASALNSPLLAALTLAGLPQPLRTLAFLAVGLLLLGWGLGRINRYLFALILPNADPNTSLLNLVYERIASADKPRVVVFSNGIGLFIVLNAIKDEVSQVDVVLPMGEDIRIYSELLNANNLKLRNVFVANLPAGTLTARFTDGSEVEGFLAIKETRGRGAVQQLFIRPREAAAQNPSSPTVESNSDLLTALRAADAVVFGPTSLFTGVIASLLAPDVAQTIAASDALKVFICPVMTEPGKTDQFSVSDHVATFERHAQFDLDYVILNNKRIAYDLARKYYDYGAEQVLLDLDEFEHTYLKVDFSDRLGEVRQLNRATLIEDDLINASVQKILGQADEKLVVRHDPEKLRRVFAKIFDFIEYRRQVMLA